MKQTIEIEVPEGKKVFVKGDKIKFVDVLDYLPKTWDEFCKKTSVKSTEVMIDTNSSITFMENMSLYYYRNPFTDKNILPSEQAAKQHLALMQLHQLRDCYRQGWKPNETINSTKFIISVLKNNEYRVAYNQFANTFLSFQSREIAEEFLNNFHDLIKQAGDLI